jgi:hypothetical protein
LVSGYAPAKANWRDIDRIRSRFCEQLQVCCYTRMRSSAIFSQSDISVGYAFMNFEDVSERATPFLYDSNIVKPIDIIDVSDPWLSTFQVFQKPFLPLLSLSKHEQGAPGMVYVTIVILGC